MQRNIQTLQGPLIITVSSACLTAVVITSTVTTGQSPAPTILYMYQECIYKDWWLELECVTLIEARSPIKIIELY